MIKEESIQYANSVLDGSIIACQMTKLACRRFLNDLERKDLFYDDKPVELFNRFCKQFQHYTGQYVGKPFTLTNWQKFFICNLLGIKYKKDGTRKYQKVYFSLARKQGKSSLIGILSLFFLMLDGEANAEVIVVANSVEQAKVNLNITTTFASQLDKSHKHIIPQFSRIKYKDNRLQIRAADHRLLDGLNTSVAIIDEMAYSNKDTYDVLLSGQVSRKQPLIIQIGTCGNDLSKYMYEQYLVYKKMLTGEVELDDRLLLIIYELDDEDLVGDKWQKEKSLLIKSNPNLGISVSEDFLLQQIESTKIDITNRNAVLIKHFNRWIDGISSSTGEDKYIDDDVVLKNMEEIDLSSLRGCWGFAAVDLSSVSDLNVLSILIPKDGYYYYKNFFFLPELNSNYKQTKSQFKVWGDAGYIQLTKGNCLDSNAIVLKLKEIIEEYQINIVELHLDVYNSTSFQLQMGEVLPDIPILPFSQSFLNFNKATKELKMLMLKQLCKIDKNSVTRWNFHNCVLKETNQGNVKCMKMNNSKSNKIDSVIAMQMALGGYLSSNYCYLMN